MTAEKTVELIPDTNFITTTEVKDFFDSFFGNHILIKDVSEIPELSQVSSCLWAKHKYDVGLIKGAEPVVITPKSLYRPCKINILEAGVIITYEK